MSEREYKEVASILTIENTQAKGRQPTYGNQNVIFEEEIVLAPGQTYSFSQFPKDGKNETTGKRWKGLSISIQEVTGGDEEESGNSRFDLDD